MQPIALVPHLSLAELEQAYRTADRPVERTRWQILWLKAKGFVPRQIAAATGYNRNTISTLVRQYNQHGPEAVRDKRQDNRSAPALNREQQHQLSEALVSPPRPGGVWTGGQVQAYVHVQFGIEITEVCAWSYFKRLGFSVQLPRPRHQRAAGAEQQAAFKKK